MDCHETKTILETSRLVTLMMQLSKPVPAVSHIMSAAKERKEVYKIGNTTLTLKYPEVQMPLSSVEYLWKYSTQKDFEDSRKFVQSLLSTDKR